MDKEIYNEDGELLVVVKCISNKGVETELQIDKIYEPIQDWFEGEWEILNEKGYYRMYAGSRFDCYYKEPN